MTPETHQPKTKSTTRRRAGGRPWKPGQSGNPAQRWKPGQSGNPAGRPKGVKFLSEGLRELLVREGPSGKGFVDALALALIERACKGDVAAFREIADRVEGKVTLPVGGPDGRDLLPPACKGMSAAELLAEAKALIAIVEQHGEEGGE